MSELVFWNGMSAYCYEEAHSFCEFRLCRCSCHEWNQEED